MSDRRRAAITGIGLITPLASGTEPTWEAVVAGRSGTAPPTQTPEGFTSVGVVGEAGDFDPSTVLPPKVLARTDRNAQFAFLAGFAAFADAAFDVSQEDRDRIGVVMAANYGGIAAAIDGLIHLHQQGPSFVSPFTSTAWLPFASVGQLSIAGNLTGYCKTVLADAAGGLVAIGIAADAIARGDVDVVLSGGSESPVNDLALAAMATSPTTCTDADDPAAAHRPFDLGRRGSVVSEGCGMVVLEAEEHARERGARIYGYVSGFGQTTDGVAPNRYATDGVQYGRAMREALQRAGLAPEDVALVSADGQATEDGDRAEAAALRTALGERLADVAVTAPKSMLGNSLAGTGGVELGLAALALHHACAPPVINVADPDPECDLPLVLGGPADLRPGAALVCGRGGGGTNAVLAVESAGA